MGQAKHRRQLLGALYGTPEGSNRPPVPPATGRPVSAELLEAYLNRDDRREVALLLRDGPANWERCYSPLPQHAAQVAQVVVRCIGELAEVVLEPIAPSPSTASP